MVKESTHKHEVIGMKEIGKTIMQTVMVDISLQKAPCISDSGKMTYRRVTAENKCLIIQFLKVNFKTEQKTDLAHIYLLMDLNIMDSLKIIYLMEQVHLNGQIQNNT